MNIFTINTGDIYQLVYNFTNILPKGELMKKYSLRYNNDAMGTSLSGVTSHRQYDKSIVLVTITSVSVSGYKVSVDAETNRRNVYTLDYHIVVDNDEPVFSYNDLIYRIQTSEDDHSTYVLISGGSGLLKNTEYSVSLSSGLSGIYNSPMVGSYNFSFSTTLCPLFTTPSRVKMRGGPELDSYTDDTIYRMIYKNSMDAIDIMNLNAGLDNGYEYFGCDYTDVPEEFRLYVECKTAYDLLALLNRYNNTGTSQSKHLGDMTISYGGTPGQTGGPLKELYNCYNSLINNLPKGSNMAVAIKGIYDTSKLYNHPLMNSSNRVIKWATPNTPGTSHRRTI